MHIGILRRPLPGLSSGIDLHWTVQIDVAVHEAYKSRS